MANNVYYHKARNRWFVWFRRRGQHWLSPYYKTEEEALKARNLMLKVVPPSLSTKGHQSPQINHNLPNWFLKKALEGEHQPTERRDLDKAPTYFQQHGKRYNKKK